MADKCKMLMKRRSTMRSWGEERNILGGKTLWVNGYIIDETSRPHGAPAETSRRESEGLLCNSCQKPDK